MTNHEPVLALLPFEASGATDSDALIAQGLIEDVSAELTRFRTLQIISWMSAAAVAGLPEKEIGARLGATHVVRGRLRRASGRLRITASLIACADGAQLFSEQFETSADDIFAVQDDLVARIAATLAGRLEESALQEARGKPTTSLAAYELTLRGMALLRRGTLEADEESRGLFQDALSLDPHYARAHAGLALSHFNEWSCQYWNLFQENGRQAYGHAHRALELDDRDAMLHVVVGRIQLYRREFEQASWYFDRAQALCPNDAELLIQLATCDLFMGRPEVGRERVTRAMRLNPYHPNSYYAAAALVHFGLRDFEAALALAAKAGGMPFIDAPVYLAIAYAHLGRMEEARSHFAAYGSGFRKAITYGREPEPGEPVRWLLDVNPYRRPEDTAFLLNGLRMLGEEPPSAATAPRGAAAAPTGDICVLARQGDGWLADYDGRRAVLPGLKGLGDICRLVVRPGEEIHCLDLAGRSDDAFGGDNMLDDKARQSLKERIRDLQDEVAEAEEMNDAGRADRARAELDGLVDALSRALGIGGRARRLGSLAERARTTVTWRIRHAVRRIEAVHPPLARHLGNSLRTGTFCSYRPERPVPWQIGGAADGARGATTESTPIP